MSKAKPELVRVEWRDIASMSGWHELKAARALRPVKCVDVGWVLDRDDECLLIFRSRNSDGSVGDLACFPWGCVVRVTPLEPAAKHVARKEAVAGPPKEGAQ